jgi:SAM-dependent methyltransferase
VAADVRAAHEIDHGRWLAARDPEVIWGWGTPAGRLRAERRARLIAEAAGVRRGSTALELGCGTGLFTEHFAATGARIVAVDISADLLAIARTRGLPADRISFLCTPFEALTVDGTFDAVIGSSVLHHLDLALALASIRRLLRPGGVMSVAEPNMLNPQIFLERHPLFLRRLFQYVSPDETAFVRWRLARTLAEAGFVRVSVTPFDWLHPSVPRPLIPAVQRCGRVAESLPLVREFAGSLHIVAVRGGA